jgi:prefoldin subunit 5
LRLIIDIQNSLKATEKIGYKKWAEKFNLEQMSQTLLFIERHQLTLGELENMATQKPKTLAGIKSEIESVDAQLQNISTLQRHIGTYGKTKEIYKQYKQSKTPEQFREENSEAISAHEMARAYFDECGYGFGSGNRLPSIKELREQYATHNTEKKSLWAKYHDVRNSDKEIDNAWANVKTLLNLKDATEISASEIALDESKPETGNDEMETPTKRNAPSL